MEQVEFVWIHCDEGDVWPTASKKLSMKKLFSNLDPKTTLTVPLLL
jgi:hypothetical protein